MGSDNSKSGGSKRSTRRDADRPFLSTSPPTTAPSGKSFNRHLNMIFTI